MYSSSKASQLGKTLHTSNIGEVVYLQLLLGLSKQICKGVVFRFSRVLCLQDKFKNNALSGKFLHPQDLNVINLEKDGLVSVSNNHWFTTSFTDK